MLKIFNKINIVAKLNLLAFGGIAGLLLITFFNFYSGYTNSKSLKQVYDVNVHTVNSLQELELGLRDIKFRLAATLLNLTSFHIAKNNLNTLKENLSNSWKAANELKPSDDQEKVLFEKLQQGWPEIEKIFNKIDVAYATQDKDKVTDIVEVEWANVQNGFIKPLDELLAIKKKETQQVYDQSV